MDAIHGSPDKPLKLGENTIECYVLQDRRRVLMAADVQRAIGLADGGSMVAGTTRLSLFASGDRVSKFLSAEARAAFAEPIKIKKPNGTEVLALEAELFPELCQAVVDAARYGVLQEQQLFIAHQCEVILSSLQRIGIIALVDEVTGFQKYRQEDELQKILEAYVLAEHRPWVRAVPSDFFKELFRVFGWKYVNSTKGPRYAGKLVRLLIYKNLPKPVLPRLDEMNPADANWQRKHRHHQLLTDNIGLEHFKSQLVGVMALLRASSNKAEFFRLYNRAYGGQLEMDI
ncbi:P63C domain-containing protein [Affinirhizobium pseudoryzae]|uniref:P63C domain-containing protein n=1 Tax=Allorhizobium pseudoryzae TaxID=379684 RepID=UPI0013EE2E69|nr:P63C domain-containing protein [Allorhizobium pseudoryzae]